MDISAINMADIDYSAARRNGTGGDSFPGIAEYR